MPPGSSKRSATKTTAAVAAGSNLAACGSGGEGDGGSSTVPAKKKKKDKPEVGVSAFATCCRGCPHRCADADQLGRRSPVCVRAPPSLVVS